MMHCASIVNNTHVSARLLVINFTYTLLGLELQVRWLEHMLLLDFTFTLRWALPRVLASCSSVTFERSSWYEYGCQ